MIRVAPRPRDEWTYERMAGAYRGVAMGRCRSDAQLIAAVRGLRLIGLLGPLLALAAATAGQPPVLSVPDAIDGDRVHVALEPDAIRAIDRPTFLRGQAADRQMIADEPVLGVRWNGEARAYPLGFLSAHEIVNDRFGPTPVVVTW